MAVEEGPTSAVSHHWLETGVIYHIYPRSFCDSDGDGWGDLVGIIQRLDHLSHLGVSIIMISPFYESPMVDGGYDVSNHKKVDPRFGIENDFRRLVSECRRRDIRVLIDFVGNHVSDQHPWFTSTLKGDTTAKSHFIWSKQPNEWTAAVIPQSAWTFARQLQEYYLHCFLPEQPDLNWRNRETKSAMKDVLGYWLSMGVDGFRVDAAHCLIKDPDLRVRPAEAIAPLAAVNHQAETIELLGELSDFIKRDDASHVLIGEVFLEDTKLLSQYFNPARPGLDTFLNFALLRCKWKAEDFYEAIRNTEDLCKECGVWPTWVLSSHDSARLMSRVGGSEARARVAAALVLTLRGTPVIFQGDELGLRDATLPSGLREMPAFRRGSRAPIPWEEGPYHGWNPKNLHPLPFPPKSDTHNPVHLSKQSDSILALYRELIALRRRLTPLTRGDLLDLYLAGDCICYKRSVGSEGNLVVLLNFGEDTVEFDQFSGHEVLFHSSMNVGGEYKFSGTLDGETALVLANEEYLRQV